MASIDRIAAMKRAYSQYMAELPNWDKILLDLIEKSVNIEWNGKMDGLFVPFHKPSGLRSSGPHKEGENLQPYKKEEYGQMQAFLRSFHIKIELTAEEMHGIQLNNAGSISIKAKEIESKTEAFRWKRSRMLYSTGYGNLGTVSAVNVAGGNSTITFDADTNMEWFEESMFVEFWIAAFPPVTRHGHANSTTRDAGFEITSVSRDVRQIVVSGDVTAVAAVVAGDVCYSENVAIAVTGTQYGTGKELPGFQALISDGVTPNANLQGVAYATNTALKSIIDSAGADREITLDRYQAFIDKVENRAGKDGTKKIAGKGVRRKLLQIGYQDVRHVSEQIKLGWTNMSMNGEEFIFDRMCPPGMVWAIDLKQFRLGQLFDLKSLDKADTGERTANTTVYEMIWGVTDTMYILRSNSSGRLQDLIEP